MTHAPIESRGATLVETALGAIGLAWSSWGLTRLQLPEPSAQATLARLTRANGGATEQVPSDVANDLPAFVAEVAALLVRYARGDRVDFSDVPVDLTGADPFRISIYDAARALGYGETTTYAGLAEAAGHPGMARETGVALGRNPVAIIVPCHRIVAAGGRLGGFSAPGGALTKQKLLAMESARPPPAGSGQASFASEQILATD